jgi:hypothetical protein
MKNIIEELHSEKEKEVDQLKSNILKLEEYVKVNNPEKIQINLESSQETKLESNQETKIESNQETNQENMNLLV